MAQLMSLPLTVSCFSKIQIGLLFWHRLTRVVPEKRPLNGCSLVISLHVDAVYSFADLTACNSTAVPWALSSSDAARCRITLDTCLCVLQADLPERPFFENQSHDHVDGTNLHAPYYPYSFAGLCLNHICIYCHSDVAWNRDRHSLY